ncbi:MAG: hypothetical protein ABIP94_08110 [Planctomycetota bacterium]
MNAAAATEALAIAKRLCGHVLEPMKRTFVGKDEVIDVLGVCLAAAEHAFLLGPPGTAKSAIVHDLARRLDGQAFSYLLTRFTVGPIEPGQAVHPAARGQAPDPEELARDLDGLEAELARIGDDEVEPPPLRLQIAESSLELLPMRGGDMFLLWHEAATAGGALCEVRNRGMIVEPDASRPVSEDTVVLCSDDDGGVWSSTYRDGKWVLYHSSVDGFLLHTHQLPIAVADIEATPRAVALQGHFVLAVGSLLGLGDPDGKLRVEDLGRDVRSLVRSEEGSNMRVLVGFDDGFTCVDVLAKDLDRRPHHAEDMVRPTLGWTRHGVAIAIDERSCQLFRTKDGALCLDAVHAHPGGQPFAILPTPDLAEVVLVTEQTVTKVKIVG